MRNVVCPRCHQAVPVPDDLASAHCVRCGQVIALETNIPTAEATAFSAAPIDARAESGTSWEEFRANSPAVQRELMQLIGRPLPDLREMTPLRLPTDLPEELDRWDRPLATIQIGGEKTNERILRLSVCWVFIITGTGVLIGGVAGALFGQASARQFLVVGTVIAVFGVLLWWFSSWTSRKLTTIWVFEEGLYLTRYGQSRAAAWTAIQDFEVSMATGRPRYWLTIAHGHSVAISVAYAPELMPIMEYVEIRLAGAQFLRRLEAIWEGRPQRFGIVTLDGSGLKAPRFYAPWSKVHRVVSDAQNIFVDWAGVTEWSAIPYDDVSFPYLVIAISHVMIEEHERFPKN